MTMHRFQPFGCTTTPPRFQQAQRSDSTVSRRWFLAGQIAAVLFLCGQLGTATAADAFYLCERGSGLFLQVVENNAIMSRRPTALSAAKPSIPPAWRVIAKNFYAKDGHPVRRETIEKHTLGGNVKELGGKFVTIHTGDSYLWKQASSPSLTPFKHFPMVVNERWIVLGKGPFYYVQYDEKPDLSTFDYFLFEFVKEADDYHGGVRVRNKATKEFLTVIDGKIRWSKPKGEHQIFDLFYPYSRNGELHVIGACASVHIVRYSDMSFLQVPSSSIDPDGTARLPKRGATLEVRQRRKFLSHLDLSGFQLIFEHDYVTIKHWPSGTSIGAEPDGSGLTMMVYEKNRQDLKYFDVVEIDRPRGSVALRHQVSGKLLQITESGDCSLGASKVPADGARSAYLFDLLVRD